jgi:mono/diheme cytochrome c family protein
MGIRTVLPVALVILFTACTADEPAPPTEGTVVLQAPGPALELTRAQLNGKQLFETVCWTCHGPAGRGDGPVVRAGAVVAPPNFQLEPYQSLDAAELIRRFSGEVAQRGATHPHMQYIASVIEPEVFKEALAFIPSLVYPVEIEGSALAGQQIYQVRCAGCHGEGGQGDGQWAEMLKGLKPANFTQDTLLVARDYDAVFKRIREGGQSIHGSSMPPWGVLFTEGEMWDLVAYLSLFNVGTSN